MDQREAVEDLLADALSDNYGRDIFRMTTDWQSNARLTLFSKCGPYTGNSKKS
jgi:hypothetical protein